MSRRTALRAWRLYVESSARLMAELERRMKSESGLDMSDFNILLLLSEADGGRMRMGDLARELAFAPGRLTYRVSTLEARGWITRASSAEDGRVVWAELTDAGSTTLRRARPQHARDVDDLIIDHLSADDVEAMQRIFSGLDTRMRNLSHPPVQGAQSSG